jgi:hypothetical protein
MSAVWWLPFSVVCLSFEIIGRGMWRGYRGGLAFLGLVMAAMGMAGIALLVAGN